MNEAQKPDVVASFFPKLTPWSQAVALFVGKRPGLALGVLRPFAGAVFLLSGHNNTPSSNVPRDTKGYSVALRMALYVTRLLSLEDFTKIVPQGLQVQYLYLLALTYELVNDQIDLLEDDMLFEKHLNPDSMQEIRDMLRDILFLFSTVTNNARLWREDAKNSTSLDNSRTVRDLVNKFLEVSRNPQPLGYYAGKALSRFLGNSQIQRDWIITGSDEWLVQLGIMNNTTPNLFGASAILIGIGNNLRTSATIKTMCNRLVSDLAIASPQTGTLEKLVLLNSCLGIYANDDDEVEIPVAQIRLIPLVRQLLSWSGALTTTHIELASEACRALHLLLPAIKDVYGSYWQDTLNLITSIWRSIGVIHLLDDRIPAIGMSLKLVSILRLLADANANDDLTDALAQSKIALSSGLVDLLKLARFKNNLPLEFVDELLLRHTGMINRTSITNLSELYPLVASDFRMIQSAAYDVLQNALVDAQQEISLDTALEETGKAYRRRWFKKLTCFQLRQFLKSSCLYSLMLQRFMSMKTQNWSYILSPFADICSLGILYWPRFLQLLTRSAAITAMQLGKEAILVLS
jgi:E3 ubiquitin-protein ligase listerin